LRDALARLYPLSASWHRIAEDAGLTVAHIEFGGSAKDVWYAIVKEAERAGRLDALVRLAREEYPLDPLWHDYTLEGQPLPEVPRPVVRAGVERRLWIILGPLLSSAQRPLLELLAERALTEADETLRIPLEKHRDKPSLVLNTLRRVWPGRGVRDAIEKLLDELDQTPALRASLRRALSRIPKVRFIDVSFDRSSERCGSVVYVEDVRSEDGVPPDSVFKTRGDRSRLDLVEAQLDPKKSSWVRGSSDAEAWRASLSRSLERGHALLLAGFEDDQAEAVLHELRELFPSREPDVWLLPEDIETALALSFPQERIVSLHDPAHAVAWVDRLRDAIEVEQARERVTHMEAIVVHYGEGVSHDFEQAFERARRDQDSGRFAEALRVFTQLLQTARGHVAREPGRWRVWMSRCAMSVASTQICLQRLDDAKTTLAQLSAEDIHALDARGRAVLAEQWVILDEEARAREIFPSVIEGSEDDLRRIEEARWHVALHFHEIPSGVVPRSPYVRLDLAEEWRTRGDLAKAAEHALGVAEQSASRALVRYHATALLVTVLAQEIWRHPVAEVLLPTEFSVRERIVRCIEHCLATLADTEPVFAGWSERVLEVTAEFYDLTRDRDRRDAAIKRLRAQDATRDEIFDMRPVVDLLHKGQKSEAFASLPSMEPPWRRVIVWSSALAQGGLVTEALDALERLTESEREHQPVAMMLGQLYLSTDRIDDALRYARRAHTMLPGRGMKALFAHCLHRVGQNQEAWSLANDLRDTRDPAWLRSWAVIGGAASIETPESNSVSRWKRFVDACPDDVPGLMALAQTLATSGDLAQAADVSWRVVEHGLAEGIDSTELARIAMFQRLAGLEERRERVHTITAAFARRFPGDPRAEAQRFELLTALDFPDDLPPADHGLLQRGDFERAVPFPEALRQIENRNRFGALIHLWYRLGKTSFEGFSSLSQVQPARVVSGFAEASRERAVLLSAPVRAQDPPPLVGLSGVHLVLGHLELLVLQRLDLLSSLFNALGPEGRIVVFNSTWDAIVEDAAAVERATQRLQHASLESLLSTLHNPRRFVLHQGLPEPRDDHAWASSRGLRIISDPTPDAGAETDLLLPRVVADRLLEKGRIDASRHRELCRTFREAAGPNLKSASWPERIAIGFAALLGFHEGGVLADVCDLFESRMLEVGPQTVGLLHARRDGLRRTIEAAELARALLQNLGARRETHVQFEEAPEVSLPPPRVGNDFAERLVQTPLRAALSLRRHLRDHVTDLAVTADWFNWRPDRAVEVWHELAWANEASAREQVDLARSTEATVLSLSDLLPYLSLGAREHDTRATMAKMGFVDALDVPTLVRLALRYRSLAGAIVKSALDSIEVMVRPFCGFDAENKPLVGWHLGRVDAAVAVARLYAHTVVELHRTDGLSEDERARMVGDLFGRLEQLAGDGRLDLVALGASFLPGEALRRLSEHVRITPSGATILPDGPVFVVWRNLVRWASDRTTRRAALARGHRRVLLAVDREDSSLGWDIAMHLLLTLGDRDVAVDKQVVLLDPPWSDLAVLSATWKIRPLESKVVTVTEHRTGASRDVTCEWLLREAARMVSARSAEVRFNAIEMSFVASLFGGQVRIPVRARTEAVLLRADDEPLQISAGTLARLLGPMDAESYQALIDLTARPGDLAARRRYAQLSCGATWRTVREDPTTLLLWAASSTLMGSAPTNIETLRAMLSEPPGPLTNGGRTNTTLAEALSARRREGGTWVTRSDAADLQLRAASVPWSVFVLAYARESGVSFVDVEEVLHEFETPDEQPIGRLCAGAVFLSAVARQQRYVQLSGGEVDLGARLSSLWLAVLRSADTAVFTGSGATTARGTLAVHEAALLRVCGQTVRDLATGQGLSVPDGLWLTWRLYNWLVDVLDTLPPTERREAIDRLAHTAPQPEKQLGGAEDLWNPFGFDRFNHRMVALLYAFTLGDELARNIPSADPVAPTTSPEIEALLVDLASRPLTEFELSLRERGDRATHFDWSGPTVMPDLALKALLSVAPEAFARFDKETRERWLRSMPEYPEQQGRVDAILAGRLLNATASVVGSLTRPEQLQFKAYLNVCETSVPERTTAWKLFGFASLFAAGHRDLREVVRAGLLLHAETSLAPRLFVSYLDTLTRDDPSLLATEMEQVLADLEASPARTAFALTPAGLVLGGTPAQTELASRWLRALAHDPRFEHDTQVQEALQNLGLDTQRDTTHV
jgi:tetratricopeptide (TPR) repeat protein